MRGTNIIRIGYSGGDPQKTQLIAKKYAHKLLGGEVLCLIGDLGAGKTAFTKGLADGLKIKNQITSPTFVLMKNYKVLGHKTIKHLVHIDAYRLSDGSQLMGIGAEDFFNKKDSVVVIEWADRVKDIWPQGVVKIEFKIGSGDKREIKIN